MRRKTIDYSGDQRFNYWDQETWRHSSTGLRDYEKGRIGSDTGVFVNDHRAFCTFADRSNPAPR